MFRSLFKGNNRNNNHNNNNNLSNSSNNQGNQLMNRNTKMLSNFPNRPLNMVTHPINDDYEITDKTLGLGINGKVVECYHKRTKEKFALKVRVN